MKHFQGLVIREHFTVILFINEINATFASRVLAKLCEYILHHVKLPMMKFTGCLESPCKMILIRNV